MTKELQEKDKDIEQLQEELIEARESSAGGDQEMLQKLQDLMVSLQLKDQDMKKQGELLDHLVQEKEEFEKQLEEARMEVGAKEAEASTIRTYFDKSEADKDKLQEELTQLRKAHTKA